MKKSITAAMISAALFSMGASAQETKTDQNWVGAFGMYYNTDGAKPEPSAHLDDGYGIGGEAGFRFDESWAARVSATYLDIDSFGGAPSEDGLMVGVDALYFFPDDLYYLFGGLYHQKLDDSYKQAGFGIGKHWDIGNNLAVITEVAAYHDFGEAYNDYDVKIGLAYYFGGETSSYKPTPAPVAQAVDSDRDGVLDNADKCPNTRAGVAVDANGCNNDLDKDGIINAMDQCPNTPMGTPVDAKGCAIVVDSDNDGVADSQDICPDTPLGDEVHPDGCTVFKDKEVSIQLRILFANNSADVEDPNDPELVEFAQFMKRYGKTNALIEGHTSAPGSAKYNKDLSLRRANALKAVLIDQYDIDPARLDTVGYGEERLLDTSNTTEANKINRRIEIKVTETVKVPVQE